MDFTMLIEAGVDVKGATERFMGNEQLFAKMLKKFVDEPSYGKLCAAIEAKDEKEALAASHTLKGLCGNLSLTRLFELFAEQVTLMRANEWDKAVGMMPEITENYEQMTQTINKWFDTL